MRINVFHLVLLFGVIISQETLQAENVHQKNDSLAQVKSSDTRPADTVAAKDNIPARSSDLAALEDRLNNNLRLTIASQWTINLSGYGILGLQSSQAKSGAANPYLSLYVPGAGITLGGLLRQDPYKDGDLSYSLQFLYGTSAGSTTLSFGNVSLNWALLTNKQKEDPFYDLSITAGQQLLPFGSDNLAGEDKRPTIAYAQYTSKVGSGRDIGLLLDNGFWNTTDPTNSLTVPKLEVLAGLFNGAGANNIDTGALTSKDVFLKAIYNPVQDYTNLFGQLSFAGSAWWHGLDWQSGNPTAGESKELQVPTQRYAGEIDWLKKPLQLTLEYVSFKKSPIVHPTKAVDTTGNSFVGTVFWTDDALPNFQPLIRYDYFDPNYANNDQLNAKGIAPNKSDASEWITAGFNLYLYQVYPLAWRPYAVKETNRVIKLQANYTWKIEQTNGNWVDKTQNNVFAVWAFFLF
jgi:hypothetical protein